MLDDNAFSIKEQRKTFVGFHIPKNISLKRHFIQHKPLISKQCHSYIFMRVTQLFVFLKLPKYVKKPSSYGIFVNNVVIANLYIS